MNNATSDHVESTSTTDADVSEKPSWLVWAMIRISLYSVGLYLFAVVFLAWNETSLVYPGATTERGNWNPKFLDFEEVKFQSEDGTNLVGWFLPAPGQVKESSRNILICHGNAENVAMVANGFGQTFQRNFNANVFIFDYRGFGKSEGTPDEDGVFADSVAALDVLCQKTNSQPSNVILVGHSLGGGPAVYLAKERGCRMLVLQRTFSSLPDTAAHSYPIFPVHWIMQNRMDSINRIGDCPQPLFQSHGAADSLIPISLARRLFDKSPTEKKQFFAVEDMDHWDPLPTQYWVELKAFMGQLEGEGDDPSDPSDSNQPESNPKKVTQ